jgi:hypothetical protein
MPAPAYDSGRGPETQTNAQGSNGAPTPAANTLINVTGVTQTAFEISGGYYGVEAQGTGAGTITLQKLASDQATWYTAATFTAVGPTLTLVQLPRGQYRWTTAGFTAVYASVSRIPQA